MNSIIEAKNLSRFYGIVLGLNNVSFAIGPGITGIVGPNGSGKTTLFRLLTGQIRPSSGLIEVFGESPWNNPRVQGRVAYCPESEAVPRGVDPLNWLIGLGMISGFSRGEAKARAQAMLDRVGLPREAWKKNLTVHSKGMKQRVKLAQCLLHEPELIILDEPMNGLDPMGREEFSTVLTELAENGTHIVISSHLLHDLEALCPHFVLFRCGRILQPEHHVGSAGAGQSWPESTTFRCASSDQLAEYLVGKKLVQGYDAEGPDRLHVRWKNPARFYESFYPILLESQVLISEVHPTTSALEHAIQAPTL